MRKIIYGAGTSLDGYIAWLDGSLDFLHVRPSNYSMGPLFTLTSRFRHRTCSFIWVETAKGSITSKDSSFSAWVTGSQVCTGDSPALTLAQPETGL
jgi:hypothetical protein